MRVAVVGVSASPVCGARDHADGLARAMHEEGAQCSVHWLLRDELPMRAAGAQMREWARGLPAELSSAGADIALLHYSVFSYSYRGVPLYLRPVLSALRRSRLPLVTVLHEFAFPWTLDGLRGKVWAVTQRALLVEVMRASAGVIVTTDFREEWLSSRAWLARRPIAVTPVFSNLPPPLAELHDGGSGQQLGMFGYSYPRATVRLILDALALLRESGLEPGLALLGAPGADSRAGELWREEARSRVLGEAVRFSGTIPAQELSDALARCAVLLFADPSGPTSRKTTLAAGLASGTPVLALDGPHTWEKLRSAEAARVAPAQAEALAREIRALLGQPDARAVLGAHGREFVGSEMSPQGSAAVVSALLDRVLG